MSETAEAWTCARCGTEHDSLVMMFGAAEPLTWQLASDEERASGELTADQCVVTVDGQEFFFLRGHIEIPVLDAGGELFVWSVWVSVSEESMAEIARTWDNDDRATYPPRFGWLNTALPYEESTVALPTMVHQRAPGTVPYIEVDPGVNHVLVQEQHAGMSRHRVSELNTMLR